MSLVATQEGCLALWRQMLGLQALGVPWARLLGQPHTPSHADTLATLAAAELVVAGYQPLQILPVSAWSLAPLPDGGQAAYPLLQWTFSAAATVYGYFLVDGSQNYSLWAEAFAAPFVVPPGGALFSLSLAPTLTSTP